MFSNIRCFFPIVRTPLQKATCLGMGITITGTSALCIKYTAAKIEDYYDNNYVVPYDEKNKPDFKLVEREPTIFDKIGKSLVHVIFSPFVETRNPYTIALSLPVTGMYTLGGGIGGLAWYYTSIDDFVNVKKADQ